MLANQPSVASAAMLARRLFAMWKSKSADDIISKRASLPAVCDLKKAPGCSPVDVENALRNVSCSASSHFAYRPISKVAPLAFAWSSSADCTKQLLTDVVPKDRLPIIPHSLHSARQIQIPMVTLIDHVDDNVCGHPGLIHGGMTTTIANSSLSLLAALNAPKDARIVPLSLNMDYRKPIPTNNFVKIHAWLYQIDGDKLKTAIHFYSLKNEMLVEAVSDIAVYPLSVVD
ncbi:hypothetical protein GGI11_004324 [Coemansia sp. RSA 2049]|nr:hypothetical protein H4217_008889 [Coemansia sp. RSA 1939]KAJ2513690.1 hypothetical protein GGI11_004324 [Coemansia sp. RSA 2049]